MSVHLSSEVWKHSQAKGSALLVLLSLADQANDQGECWPSVAGIAQRCRISERSVHRYLDTLVDLGEITRIRYEGRASRYRVHPCQSGTPDSVAPLPVVAEGSANGWQNTSATVGRQSVINHHESSLAKTRARILPIHWSPTLKHRTYANEHGIDVDHEADQFRNHHTSKASKFTDWDAAFRTWLGNAKKWSRPAPPPQTSDPHGEWFSA